MQPAPAIALRDAVAADFDAIVALNAADVAHTSAMDTARLRTLHALAAYHRVATVDGAVAAFLLAMADDSGYVNDNFGWFAARGPGFVYVDRIVVGARHRGLGLASRLYADLFAFARERGAARIACEYNVIPPNEPSRRFHDRFGFHEVGRQWLDGGAKQVSMQVAELASVPAPDAAARPTP